MGGACRLSGRGKILSESLAGVPQWSVPHLRPRLVVERLKLITLVKETAWT
jgi:hypothetical protein